VDQDVRHLHQELAFLRFADARRVVERVQGRDKNKALLMQALVLFHKGRQNQCLSYLRRLDEVGYEHAEKDACLARLHLSWDNPSGAVESARRALEAEPESHEYRWLLARALAGDGERRAAIEALQSTRSGELPAALLLLRGDLLLEEGDGDGALAAYLDALQRAPIDPEPIRRTASWALTTGRMDEGIDLMTEIEALSPLIGAAAFAEGARLALIAGKPEALAALVSTRLTREDAPVSDLLWAARLLLASGDTDAALAAVKRARAMPIEDAERADLRLIEATLLWTSGDVDGARARLERAIGKDPGATTALLDLAFLLLWSQARPPLGLIRSLLSQARENGAHEGQVALHEVLALVEEGRTEQARDRFRMLISSGDVRLRRP
jgi:tetratricopeptide (TPR) repeat protein